MVDPVEYVKTWALGYVGQWRSMDALGRRRFEAALAHFGEVTGDGLDAVAAREALRQIRAEAAPGEPHRAAVQPAT